MYQIKGTINSDNAAALEKDIMSVLPNELDAAELEYISSAGLRVLLKLAKAVGHMTICNVNRDIYEIFSTTGFTAMMDIIKKPREISLENAELIGAGANGRVYRLNGEQIVKLYNPVSNPPEKIRREQKSAREAFIHGVPSAIPFDIVSAGDETGMIYELVDAQTLGTFVHNQPEKLEEYALKMSSLLKKLHSTVMPDGALPDARISLRVWTDIAEKSGFFAKNDLQKVCELIDSIPPRNTFIHGDFHPGNIMLSDGELILIDMGDASVGHPVTDLLGTYQIMRFLPTYNEKAAMRYTSMSSDEVIRMWDIFIRDYLETHNESVIKEFETSITSYCQIRSLGGIVFSDVIPDEKRRAMSAIIMKNLLQGIEKADAAIKLL